MEYRESSPVSGARASKDGRYRIVFSTALICVILDQLTKLAVVTWIPFQHGIPFISGFFDLVHVRNRGAAFGILNRSDIDWQFCSCCRYAGCSRSDLQPDAIFPFQSGSFSGIRSYSRRGCGNLIDRVRAAAVIDFVDLHIAGWHWPAFNVADIGICLGAALCALCLWRSSGSTGEGKVMTPADLTAGQLALLALPILPNLWTIWACHEA